MNNDGTPSPASSQQPTERLEFYTAAALIAAAAITTAGALINTATNFITESNKLATSKAEIALKFQPLLASKMPDERAFAYQLLEALDYGDMAKRARSASINRNIITFFIASEACRYFANDAANKLGTKDKQTELLGAKESFHGIKRTQVRYFHASDASSAQEIAALINATYNLVDSAKAKPTEIEIWIPETCMHE